MRRIVSQSFALALAALLLVPWGADARKSDEADRSIQVGAYASPPGSGGVGWADVFVAVSFERLQFLKTPNRYLAKYQLLIEILDDKGRRVGGEVLDRRCAVDDFRATGDPEKSQVSHVRVALPPGDYDIVAIYRDQGTQSEERASHSVKISTVADGAVGLGDPILLGSREEAARGDFSGFESLIFLDRGDPAEDLVAVFRVVGGEGQELSGKAYLLHPGGDAASEVRFSFPGGDAWRFVQIPVNGIPTASYQLVVSLDAGASVRRPLVIRSGGMGMHVRDIDEAIDQLIYISKDEERKAMRDASPERRRELFEDFWRAKDPSPGTPENELMDEYYTRVRYADEAFRCFKAGWKTDRGWTYITYGPPAEVERHPFEIDARPYEVWVYFQPDRRFVFVDRNGFGDYDLTESAGGNFRYGLD